MPIISKLISIGLGERLCSSQERHRYNSWKRKMAPGKSKRLHNFTLIRITGFKQVIVQQCFSNWKSSEVGTGKKVVQSKFLIATLLSLYKFYHWVMMTFLTVTIVLMCIHPSYWDAGSVITPADTWKTWRTMGMNAITFFKAWVMASFKGKLSYNIAMTLSRLSGFVK